MNRTIYIRGSDAAVWKRARELSGDKLSSVIIEGLKRFIEEQEGSTDVNRVSLLISRCARLETRLDRVEKELKSRKKVSVEGLSPVTKA